MTKDKMIEELTRELSLKENLLNTALDILTQSFEEICMYDEEDVQKFIKELEDEQTSRQARDTWKIEEDELPNTEIPEQDEYELKDMGDR